MKKIRLALYALIVLLIAMFALYELVKKGHDALQEGQKVATERTAQTASIGAEFTLINQDGDITHSSDFDGKYRLVYFGFSHCPNICPTDLAIMSDAVSSLPKDIADRVAPLFITVDPERDTPARLKEYLQSFEADLIALTGEKEAIDAVVKGYRVYAKKALDEAAPDGYSMNHSGITYFMGPTGEFITHFNHETDPQAMASRIATEMK